MGFNNLFMNLVYPFPKQALDFTCLPYTSYENTVGKREITRYKWFLLYPHGFFAHLENFIPFSSYMKWLSANSWVWKSLKFVVWERDILFFHTSLS